MLYRKLGSTGLEVSQLGFGAMRLPMIGTGKDQKVNRDLAIPMIRRALDAGVNYVDTAVGYCHHDSQYALGEAIRGRRDTVIVSTKNPYYGDDEKKWRENLENSLKRIGVDYIDIYNHHGVNWKSYQEHVEPHMGKWMHKAKNEGLIRHVCCSFHDNNDALMKLVDSGYPEVITLQYNLFDRQLEPGIARAHEKGIGVVVMGPVGGGRLVGPSAAFGPAAAGAGRMPELAMRFVLANPNVSVALSGMSTMQQVEENVAVACDGAVLSEADKAAIDRQLAALRKLADLYCTGCGYCMPCPSNVDIRGVFDCYNHARVYGLLDSARDRYAGMTHRWSDGKDVTAAVCTDCGACEPKCPQKIEIRKQLKEAHEMLGKKAT